MNSTIKRTIGISALAAGMMVLTNSAQAVTYTFTQAGTSQFDGGAGGGDVGDFVTQDGLVLSIVDVIGFATNSTGSATTSVVSDGAAHVMNIGNSEGLGIDSSGNGGHSNDAININPGEGWVFKFDQDVELNEIDFDNWNTDEDNVSFTLSSSAFTDIVIDFSDVDGSDVYSFSNGVALPANTNITMQSSYTGIPDSADEHNIRITSMTVDVIPEPCSAVLLGLGGFALLIHRRK